MIISNINALHYLGFIGATSFSSLGCNYYYFEIAVFNNLGIDDSIELDIDVDDETEKALKAASTSDIIDLAGVLGLHSMMNQEQFHSAQSEKWADRPDPTTGWSGKIFQCTVET